MKFSQRRCEFWRGENCAFKRRAGKLTFQFALAPSFTQGKTQVKLANPKQIATSEAVNV